MSQNIYLTLMFHGIWNVLIEQAEEALTSKKNMLEIFQEKISINISKETISLEFFNAFSDLSLNLISLLWSISNNATRLWRRRFKFTHKTRQLFTTIFFVNSKKWIIFWMNEFHCENSNKFVHSNFPLVMVWLNYVFKWKWANQCQFLLAIISIQIKYRHNNN